MWECKIIGCPFDDGENCLHEGSCVLDKKDHVHPYIKDAFDKIRSDTIDEFAHALKETFNNEFPINYHCTQPYFTLDNVRVLVDLVAKEQKQ